MHLDFENISEETVGKYFEEKDVFFSCMGTTLRQAGSAVSWGLIVSPVSYGRVEITTLHVSLISLFLIGNIFGVQAFLNFWSFCLPVSIFLLLPRWVLPVYLSIFFSRCLRHSTAVSFFLCQFLGVLLMRIPLRFY